MRPLSHSSITLYLQCPLKYKFQYIDKLKEKPRSYLSFGSSVHSALEYFFGEKFFTPPSLEDVFEQYKKEWINEGYASEEEEKKYFEEGKRILSDFYAKHTAPYVRPLAVEYELLFDVEGVKVKGYVDRIDKIDDKSVEVVDYKTSKHPYSLSALREEPQLTMYQLGIETVLGLRVDKLTYYHLLSQTPFTVPRHSDDQVEALKNRIVDVARRIENGEFPHKENRFCPCDFWDLCPLFRHEKIKEEKTSGTGDAGDIDIASVADEYGRLKDETKKLEARMEVLQEDLRSYMEKAGVERVFGDKFSVTRSMSVTERLDTPTAKELLEKAGLLSDAMKRIEISRMTCRRKKDKEDA